MSEEFILSDELEDEAFNFPVGEAGGSSIVSVEYTSSVEAPTVEGASIYHPLAQQNEWGSSVAGVINGIHATSMLSSPCIINGDIRIPYAGSSVAGVINGIRTDASVTAPLISDGTIILPSASAGTSEVKGLRDMYGNAVAWADLPTAENAIVLSTHYVGSYKYDLQAYKSDGYLGIQLVQDFDA